MNKLISSKYWWCWLLVIIVLANLLAAQFHFRIDLTREQRFTLSDASKRLLNNLDGNVDIQLFLKGELKAGAKELAKATSELLEEFKLYGNGKIAFHFVNPLTDLSDSDKSLFFDSLQKMGIQPRTEVAQSKKGEEQTQRIIIPGATVKYKDRVIAVDLLKGVRQTDENSLYNNATALLEYKFASAIHKISNNETPAVAYMLGNGEPLDFSVYNLIQGLRTSYPKGINGGGFTILRLDSVQVIPPAFNAIIIVKPTLRFNEAEKLKLDQYAMHGGNIIFMIDNLYAEMDSLRRDRETIAYDRGLNLEDIFFKYGVRVNQDLVQDMQCATINLVVGSEGGKPQIQPLSWPYFPLLNGSLTHPVSKNLDPVFSKFTNSIDTVKANGIQKTILLQTSLNARLTGVPAIISFEAVKLASDPQVFNKPNIPVAVLLEGKFSSLYTNRISSGMRDTLANIYKQPFLPVAEKEAKLIVCAGAEIVMNDVTQRGPVPMGFNKDINYTFANQDFIQNCFDYLVDPSGILETRSKDFTLRLLDPAKVEDNRSFWQFIDVVLPLLLVLIMGFIYQEIRRRKYSR